MTIPTPIKLVVVVKIRIYGFFIQYEEKIRKEIKGLMFDRLRKAKDYYTKNFRAIDRILTKRNIILEVKNE